MNPHRPPRRPSRGFTLIELLIVMVIIGLLAALVGPRMFGQLEGSKSKTAKVQIEMLGAALDAYRLDMGSYPSTEAGLAALWTAPTQPDGSAAANWRGPYLKKPVPNDPWGKPYHYRSPGEKGEYDLYSYGKDGVEGGEGDNADVVSWQ